MFKYIVISTIIHLSVLIGFNFNFEKNSNQKTFFTPGKYSIEVLVNKTIQAAHDLGKKKIIQSDNQYIKAGIDKLAETLAFNEPPKYPLMALHNGWQGEVLLSFYINKSGRLDNVQILKSSGYKLLDEAALTAAANWQFKEGTENLLIDYPVKFVITD